MIKKLFILCLVVAMSFSVQVFGAGGSKTTLVYAAYADIKDWDPSVAASMEVLMLQSVYETLVYYNRSDR